MSSFSIFRGLSGFFGLVTGGGEGQNPNPNPYLNPHIATASVPTSSNDFRSKESSEPDVDASSLHSDKKVIFPNDLDHREDAAIAVDRSGEGSANGLLGGLFEGTLGSSASSNSHHDQTTTDNACSTTPMSNADNDCSSYVNDASILAQEVAVTARAEGYVQEGEETVDGIADAKKQVNMDAEHSDADSSSSSDTSSVYTIESTTTVDPEERSLVHISELKATTIESMNESVKGLSVENTTCENTDRNADGEEPSSTCKSFAEELADWRAQREKKRVDWAIENAILMDSVNTGASALYENQAKGAKVDIDESGRGFVSYQDELAELKRELDALRKEAETEEDAALGTVDESAAVVNPAPTSKSFAEQLAEWRMQREKE